MTSALATFARASAAVLRVDRFMYAAALPPRCPPRCSLDVRTGKGVHAMAVLDGLGNGVFLSNSLASMYAGCDEMGEARRVFDAAEERDDVSWNSLLSGYARAGAREETLEVFSLMCRHGVAWGGVELVRAWEHHQVLCFQR
jgi:pentatricopeptide repeat protein